MLVFVVAALSLLCLSAGQPIPLTSYLTNYQQQQQLQQPGFYVRPTLYAQPTTAQAADSPPTTFTIPSSFETHLPSLITVPPTQHLSNILQAFLPFVYPIRPTTTTPTATTAGTGTPASPTYYYVQPQTAATQGTATGTAANGQQVLYYYAYPQQQQQPQQQQLASRSASYSYETPTLQQQQQPNAFTYYIHPASNYQPQV